MEKYHQRKEYLIQKLTAECKTLANKARFVKEICDDTLVIKKKKKSVVFDLLSNANYDPDPWKAFQRTRMTVEQRRQMEEEEKEKAGEDDTTSDSKEFGYLLGMNMMSLTLERIEKLMKERDDKQKDLNKIKKTTPEQMWLVDLEKFEEELEKVEAKEAEERDKEMPAKASKSKSRAKIFDKKDKKSVALKKETL